MSNIKLIDFTGKGTGDELHYAARLLAYTKNTRLQLTPDGLDRFFSMPIDELQSEMGYMSSTIASSWEFIHVTFSINGVSRACAQQITRTRTASFAMQSQRVTDMSQVSFHVPESVKDKVKYLANMKSSHEGYLAAVAAGESLEDARGLLPINVHSNLLGKYNFRAWVDLVRSRESLRVQGEYRDVIRQMKDEVFSVWPWARVFVEPKMAKSIEIMEEVAKDLPYEERVKLAKAADLIKKEAS